jgi:omega-6 fatty acid desaturase (delta-12 desaturase)
LVHIPVTFVTCTTGVWLFYVQHQFEDTYWHRQKDWDYYDAALEGSSFLVLPKPLQWITANIGIHHVHHLNARIPNYRLEEAMNGVKELQNPTRVTFRDSLGLVRLALWDEENERLVRFRDVKGRARGRIAA